MKESESGNQVKEIYGSKNESILDLLVQYFWWVSVVVSGAVYLVLKFIFPSIGFGSMMANSFAKAISGWAPFVALVFFVPCSNCSFKLMAKAETPRQSEGEWIPSGHLAGANLRSLGLQCQSGLHY